MHVLCHLVSDPRDRCARSAFVLCVEHMAVWAYARAQPKLIHGELFAVQAKRPLWNAQFGGDRIHIAEQSLRQPGVLRIPNALEHDLSLAQFASYVLVWQLTPAFIRLRPSALLMIS